VKALLLLVLFAACGGGGDDKFGSCPTTEADWSWNCRDNVEPFTSCTRPQSNDAGTALPESCVCNESGFWECNSCPFYWNPVAPPATCAPGATCVLNNWEHGCLCACGNDGRWSCAPQTIGSHCPA